MCSLVHKSELLWLFVNVVPPFGWFSCQDEPTAGLDPIVSTQVENCVREIQQVCRTCVMVTHQFSTIRRTVDRVIFLHDGKIRWDGPVTELETTTNPYVRQFFSASTNGPIDMNVNTSKKTESSSENQEDFPEG